MLMPRPPRQRKRKAGEASKSNNSTRSGRGRPMKEPSELMPSREARTMQANIIHRQLTAEMETPRKLSALEALPSEIIEQIFFHSLELNLPRASVHLAKVLSRPSVYSTLVLFAYFDSDPPRHVYSRYSAPATVPHIALHDRIQLQEDILRTRWCTLELLQSCLPALIRLTMVKCQHLERVSRGTLRQKDGVLTLEWPDSLPDGNDDDNGPPRIEVTSDMENYFNPRSAMLPRTPQDAAAAADAQHGFPPMVINKERLIKMGTPPPEEVWPNTEHRSVLAAYVIPDNIVLCKPWTDTNIKLLQLLRQGVRLWPCHDEVHRGVVPSAQATFDGMANAIHEGNELALLVLLELFDTLVQGRYPDRLPLRLFHQACSEPTLPLRLQCRMISLLMRIALQYVPADDEILTRWAIRVTNSSAAEEHDLSVASEVLQHMERQGWPNIPEGLAMLPPGRAPPFTAEIGYLQNRDGYWPGSGWRLFDE